MRALLSTLILFALSSPVFAIGIPLPEPETLGLLAIGAAGAMLVLRRKK